MKINTVKLTIAGLIVSVVAVLLASGCPKPVPSPTPSPKPAPSPVAPASKPAASPAAAVPSPKPAASAGEVFKLNYHGAFPRGDMMFEIAQADWAKTLVEKAKGRIVFEKTYAAGELVQQRDVFPSITKGVIEVGDYSWVWHAGTTPEGQVTWLPMLYESMAQQADVYWRVQRPIIDKLYQEKFNQKVLCLTANYSGGMFTIKGKPVQKMADLKGLKIRTMGGVTTTYLEALGAGTVTMTPIEVASALATGAVHGTMMGEILIRDQGWVSMIPNVLGNTQFWTHDTVCWNLDSWKKLPPDLQQLIEQHSWEVNYRGAIVDNPARMAECRRDVVKMGGTYNWIPDNELPLWKEKAQIQWEWYAKQSPLCKQLLDATLAYLGTSFLKVKK